MDDQEWKAKQETAPDGFEWKRIAASLSSPGDWIEVLVRIRPDKQA